MDGWCVHSMSIIAMYSLDLVGSVLTPSLLYCYIGKLGALWGSTPTSHTNSGNHYEEEDKHGARQPSQEERRARNILHIDLSRQASERLGLIFHCDQQHGVSSVT